MARVAIVSDTTHYLPRELMAGPDGGQVSLYVHWDGRQDREADLPDFLEFYEHLRSARELPTTSQPSVGDFLAVWEPLLQSGRDVVSVHISAGISGTHGVAVQAQQRLEEGGLETGRIAVVDSRSVCAGLGGVVLAGRAAAAGGGDLQAVVARVEAAREDVRIWFCLDTMEFLRRGGRVGAARAWIGSTLQIKPIMSIDVEVKPVERVRTTARATERMVQYLESRRDDGATAWFVQHIQHPDRAEQIVERGRELFGCEPRAVSEVGPVLGTHAGPGMIGVAALHPELLEP